VDTPMTVLKKFPDGTISKAVIDLNDVLYSSEDNKGRLLFHTENEQYYAISKIGDLEHAVEHFYQLDGNCIVNMSKIKNIRNYLRVYFTETPSKGSKFASISWIAMKVLGNEIHQWIDNNLTRKSSLK
jgi:hypothetical protein